VSASFIILQAFSRCTAAQAWRQAQRPQPGSERAIFQFATRNKQRARQNLQSSVDKTGVSQSRQPGAMQRFVPSAAYQVVVITVVVVQQRSDTPSASQTRHLQARVSKAPVARARFGRTRLVFFRARLLGTRCRHVVDSPIKHSVRASGGAFPNRFPAHGEL
jgi:hypothetical protein